MNESGTHSRLFRQLVGATPVDDVATEPELVSQFVAQLEPLRARADLEVVTLAANGARVDVVARAGSDEWRIVFGTSDAMHVDWLSVFRRPRRFAGLTGGRAVVVNGPSSSGKSSVLREIRARSGVPWVVFDEPAFGAVDVEHLIWRDRAESLHRSFLDGIAALARAGNCVAVAAGGHPRSMFDAAFVGVTTLWVGLDCYLVELVRRERGRQDVPGGLAQASLGIHDGWEYGLRFDTTEVDPGFIAAEILHAARVDLDIHPLEPGEIEAVAAVLGLARLHQGDGMYLVAWSDRQPLAHAHLALTDPPELQDVEVRQAHRRQGIASALTARAEREARQRGFDRLRLGVSVENAAAQALYRGCGFVDAGVAPQRVKGTIEIRTGPIEVDDTIMTLEKRFDESEA